MVHLGAWWNINPCYRHLHQLLAVQLLFESSPCFFIARWGCPEKLLETECNWPSVLWKRLWLIPGMIALVVNVEHLGRVCTSKWAPASNICGKWKQLYRANYLHDQRVFSSGRVCATCFESHPLIVCNSLAQLIIPNMMKESALNTIKMNSLPP